MPTARFTDPTTSFEAAGSVSNITPLKRAILEILQDAMTDEKLIRAIHNIFGRQFASESGIRSRRAELVREGFVEDSRGREKTASGRQSIVWVRA